MSFFVAGRIDPRGLCSHRRSSISKDAVAGENLVGPDARSTQEPYPSVAQSTYGHPNRAYLESLPGFRKVFAPIVALEIDSSGGKSWQGGIGKEGNHWLKWAFVEAAWAAIRSSAYFRLVYQRLRQRKTAQVSIIECARRLCGIACHLLKDRRCYEELPLRCA